MENERIDVDGTGPVSYGFDGVKIGSETPLCVAFQFLIGLSVRRHGPMGNGEWARAHKGPKEGIKTRGPKSFKIIRLQKKRETLPNCSVKLAFLLPRVGFLHSLNFMVPL